MNYRAEIDGLRALAVLAVILAHADFALFGGGFVGVDVFFVISGYLITAILVNDTAKGTFSLLRFYERRARRILPALAVVLICTVPFAWMWLLPIAYEQYSKSLMMAALSVSNIYFMRKTDYFAPDASEVPLLHTWSLGVEEQFYLLFPLLFLLRLRLKTIIRIVVALALASLALSEIGSRSFASVNYYLLPTRAWEILLGSIAAFYVIRRGKPDNGTLALLGLSMIVASIFVFDPSTRVPSLLALLPAGGAALFLVYSSATTLAGRLLAVRPLVFIGKISFSAYLWHQPVFVFYRIRSPEPPTTLVMCGLIAVTILLAAASWWFVEQPFRQRRATTRQVLASAAACIVVLAGVGAAGDIAEGFPSRVSPEVRAFAERTSWSKRCLFQVEDGLPDVPEEACMFNIGTGRTIAVWGDSISASLSPALIDMFKEKDIGVVQVTHGFCAPMIGVWTARQEGSNNCDAFNRKALEYLTKSNADTVIIAASWVNFFNSSFMQIDGREWAAPDVTDDMLAAPLKDMVQRLQAAGKQVVVVYPSPRFDKPVVDMMAAKFVKGDPTPDFAISHGAFKDNAARATAILDKALPQGVISVSPERIFCEADPAGLCYFGRAGRAYIADRGHYTRDGAQLIAEDIGKALFGDKP